jgi:LCP family protein required for cell wall assembly
MNFFRFPKTPPKNWSALIGFMLNVIVAALMIFLGFYFVSDRLAHGTLEIPVISNFIARDDPGMAPLSAAEGGLPLQVEPNVISLMPWDGTSRVTVLVMGLDFRDWSAGSGPSRTDTMMLLTLDPLNNTAGMLSIPRDLWVSIPGFDNGRINTAYFLGEAYNLPGGGPGMAVKTVESFLGVNINYYAQVDFGAFIRFVDELGGVKIDVPEKIKIDPIVGDPEILKPGRQTLFGELALAYARARNTPSGDLDRAIRQQQVIFGIRERLLKPESLTELISKAPSLYAEIAGGVSTNMTLDEVIKLSILAQKVPDGNIQRGAISIKDISFAMTPDGQSVLIPHTEKIRQLRDKIFLGSLGTLGPLTPGSPQDRMALEGARITLLNGSLTDGLAGRTQNLLESLGANVLEVSSGETRNTTRIVDFTGVPHTVYFLAELFELSPGNYELQYDPNSPVDVIVTLGIEWSTKIDQ